MKISFRLESDGMYRLIIEGLIGVTPAGPRLERLQPLPISEFEYFDEAEAASAAIKLQTYVDTYCVRKIAKKDRK